MGTNNGVLVFGELAAGKLSSVSLELLGIGRKLADLRGEKLSALLIDADAARRAQDAVAYGADCVYLIEDAPAGLYEGELYAAMLESVCRNEAKPAILLLGQTGTGRDLAPRIAFRLQAGLVTDCVGLDIAPTTRALMAVKPVFGGNVLATYTVRGGPPQIATVRRRAFPPPVRDEGRSGKVVSLSAGVSAQNVRTRVIDRGLDEQVEGPALETADVVVTGGRGIESPADFDRFITKGLAAVLGAAVGGTRGAVDAGLISEQHQVGLTGRIVAPDLYVAVGLSGAIQHMAGCSGAKNIVAINIDENAQIFRFAKFGVVGDYKEVVPLLIEKLREIG